MIADRIPEIKALSPDEKMLLAAELVDSTSPKGVVKPHPAIVDGLGVRLRYYEDHPDEVSSWEDVKSRLLDDD